MALQKDKVIAAKVSETIPQVGIVSSSSRQITFPSCYIKVVEVRGGKENMVAIVQTTLKDNLLLTEHFDFVPDLNGANFIAQAYEHLKTLPEFAGAADV
jgi:hypothetical protein